MRMGFVIHVVQWGTTSVHTEVERKYTEVAARGTPVYFRGGLPFFSFHWSPRNLQVFKFSLESL